MKMKNKLKPFISLTLTFLLVLGLTPVSLFTAAEVHALETAYGPMEGTCGNNINWTLTELPPESWDLANKGVPCKLTFSGNGSMGDFYSSNIPWIGHMPFIVSVEFSGNITNIGNYAFYKCASLKSIAIPNSVTSIGSYAFYNCNLLETVSCGSGLTSINSSAFEQTTSLKSIDLSRSKLNSIGSDAFYGSSIRSISLPNTLTTIGNCAFRRSSLNTVTLPSVATTIGDSAFSSCSNLSTINNSSYITSIGASAFASCSSLRNISLGSGLSSIGSYAFSSSGLESLNVTSAVTCSIQEGAFNYCSSLNSVTLSRMVTTIGESAFALCSNLSEVNLTNGLTNIENLAFSSCRSLTGISLPASLTAIGSRAFASSGLTSFTVPQNVSAIGYGILSGCSGLNSISVNSNAKFQILDEALCDVSGNEPNRVIAYPAAKATTDYTVPGTMKIIDQYAFYGSKITNLTLPDSVEALRNYSFASCANLSSVSIGKNTQSISLGSSGAFYGSDNLKTITTPAADSILKAIDNVLYTKDLAILYFYPFAKADTAFSVPDTVTSVNAYAFYRVSKLKELYLPQNLAALPAYAVSNNSKLHSIYFRGNAVGSSSSVSSYNAPDLLLYRLENSEGWNANGWNNMTYAVWDPDITEEDGGETGSLSWKYEKRNRRLTLTGISQTPDYNADTILPPWHSYIKEIQTIETNGEAITSIGEYAFYGAESLLRLSTDSKPSKIGTAAFAECKKLKFIAFDNIAEIGDDAFSGDIALTGTWNQSTSIYYIWKLNNVTSIGARAFKNCSSLSQMNLSQSKLTELSEEALSGCTGLTQLTLPNSLASIGSYALKDCSALATDCKTSYNPPTTFTIPNSVASIGAGAFKGCASLKSLALPNQITALADETLEGCSALSSLILPSKLASIGANAMKDCTALVGLDIPGSVASIGPDAFANAFSNESMNFVLFLGALPDMTNGDPFTNCEGRATLLYYSERDTDELWANLGGFWQQIPVKIKDHSYKAGRDHYSFSNSRESFGYDSGYRVPRQRYVDVLDSIIKGTYYYSINKRWAGSCYGMASTTLEFYENINNNIAFDLKNYASSSVKSVYDIAAPTSFGNDLGGNLKKLIEAYQISQYQPQISACGGQISKNMNNFTGLRDRITKFQTTGGLVLDETATPIVIAVYSLFGGHALVPISWKEADDGSFEIEVYDCNYPDETRIMTINREMNEFSYGFYNLAFSFVDYTAIAEGMSDVTLYSSPADDSLYLSIDKADGEVADASGNGIDKISGGYEQKPFTADEADGFSGVKSYVLPGGNYTLASEPSSETETSVDAADQDVTFFMASEDVFAEVTASDEDTALSVGTAGANEKIEMTLSAGDQAAEDESISITLINESGMERAVDIENYNGGDIQLAVSEEDVISVTAPTAAEIKIDGETANTENGSLSVSFESGEKESPIKIRELELEASCNEKNRMSAALNATVIYQKSEPLKNATLIAECYDKDNNRIASYTEKKDLSPGLNYIESFRENLRTTFPQAEGEVPVYCRMTISDQKQFSTSARSNDVTVTVTKLDPDEEEPDEPDPVDPADPIDPIDPVDPPVDPDDGNKDDDNKDDDNKDDDNKDDGNKDDDNKDDGNKDDSSGGPSNIAGGSTEETDPPAGNHEAQKVPVTAVSSALKKIKIGVGESFEVNATVTPADATDQTVTYTASNKNVTISATGKITGKKAGTSWITASSASDPNAADARIQVIVKKAPKKITLNAKSKTLKKGKSFKIKVNLPKNTASRKITFSSSKPSVAKVTAGGKVIAQKKGSATITVKTFNRKKAKLKIRVK